MLVVDECHRAASRQNALALLGEHRATLGISATPEREHDDLFETVLVPALGPVVFRYGYVDAVRDRVIVPFRLVNVSTDMTLEERERYNTASADIARTFTKVQEGEVSREVLVRKLQRRARLAASSIQRIPVAIQLIEHHRGKRTIVFHENIDAAEIILKILLSRGFRATIYHSKLGIEFRRDNLRLFRVGVFDVLVTCRALDEGLDVPMTEFAVIASSSASLRQRIQRLGRVLRPAKSKTMATIYTIYVSRPEEARLSQEALGLDEVAKVTWMKATVRRPEGIVRQEVAHDTWSVGRAEKSTDASGEET